MNRAAFFDMDRTVVRVNTATLYTRWQLRTGEARRRDMARVSWWLLRYTFGLIDVEAIARAAALPLAGRDEASFGAKVTAWAQSEVLPYVSAQGRAEVARRRDAGYTCALLTTSTPYAAKAVADALGISHLLTSRLEVRDGRFTGAVAAPLCYGHGKVKAAEAWAQEHDVNLASSAFYTDSISDLPMLERVGEPVAVNPDPRLRWVARRRGWPVERW